MRNHLYRIYLNYVNASFTLQVLDWNGSDNFLQIHNEEMAIDYTNVLGKVGDYVYKDAEGNIYFSDGGLRKLYLDGKYEWSWTTTPVASVTKNGYTLIGLVTSNKTSDKDKAAGYEGGYIVSNQNIERLGWRTYKDFTDATKFKGNLITQNDLRLCAKDLDGRTYTESIFSDKDELKQNPLANAFHASVTGEDPEVIPDNDAVNITIKELIEHFYDLKQNDNGSTLVSEWFMPTVGQMMQMMENINRTPFDYNQSIQSIQQPYNNCWLASLAAFGQKSVNNVGYLTCTGYQANKGENVQGIRMCIFGNNRFDVDWIP